MKILRRKLTVHPFRVLFSVTLATVIGATAARAQWTGPTAPAPGNNVAPPIWNSTVSGSSQNASFNITGNGTVGGAAGFGGNAPDASWLVSTPSAYIGNGVAGTIIGAGAGQSAGDIKTDGNLYVVGNEGIGTNAPSAKLQVVSNSEILRLSGWTGAPDVYYLGLTSMVGAGTVDYRFRTVDDAGGTRDVLFFDSSTGYVGIGTTAPAYNLEVQGPGASAYIRVGGANQTLYTGVITETNTGNGQFWKNGSGYAGYGGARSVNIYNSEDYPIAFFQGASERMRLNSGGNVGIGTANPSARLEVSQVTSDAGGNGFTITGTGAGAQSWQWYPSTAQSLLLMRPGLRLAMFGNDGSFAAGGLGNDSGVGADFFVNGTTGNVGVGNTSPTAKLDVAGNISSSGDVIGTRLCIGADCKNAWPVAGGGGDITAVNVGTGVAGGGVSGDVTLSLDTAYTDGRYVNVPGDTMTGGLTISGAASNLAVGGSGAFGGYAPDATWKVSSPNAYFGNGVAGTIIGAGGGQAAGAITADGDVTGGRLCIGADCRNAWPVGNNGDITSVNVGTGISGGGFIGDVSVSLDTGYTDGRYVNVTGDTMNGLLVAAPAGISLGGVTRNTWPAEGSGDMTGVTAGNGLSGGGLSGDVTLDVAVGTGIMLVADSVVLDAIWTDGRYINANGDTMTGLFTAAASGISLGGVTRNTWPAEGSGDITGVTAGSGLSGGGLSGDVTLNIGSGIGISVGADSIGIDTLWTDNRYVNITGDTMTGDLTLSGGTTDLYVNGGVALGGATLPGVGEIRTTGHQFYLNSNGDQGASGIQFNSGENAFIYYKPPDNYFQFSHPIFVPGVLGGGPGTFGAITASTGNFSGLVTAQSGVYASGGNIIANNGVLCANNGAGSCNNGVAMTAGTVYGDFAYVTFDLAENILSREDLKPGEVVSIDPLANEQVVRSRKGYDTAVAGIVSTDPGILGGSALEAKPGTYVVPLALSGRVPTKVSAENGPIHPGDLLTTANKPGYAMRCGDPLKCAGSILGKAMGTLTSGTGVITVLISLQ